MKAIVIYDSIFGNTEQIAQAIGNTLGSQDEVGLFRVGNIRPEQLKGSELILVGSPTRGFRPTKPITVFLDRIPVDGIKGVKVAAFDTRISLDDINSPVLRFFVRIFGYAAKPIADRLKKKGGELAVPPEGFYVKASEGPLKEGELDRAANWARQIKGLL